MKMKIFKVQHAEARSLLDVIDHFKSENGKATYYSETNSLIVVDYPANLSRMEELVNELDVAQKMVEIKVVIAEVSSGLAKDIGLASSGTTFSPGEFGRITSLLRTGTDSNIRTEMSVKTLNNEPARFMVAAEEIFGETSVIYPGGQVITHLERKPVGNILEVVPTVNNNGTITLTLQPSVGKVADDGTISEKSIYTQVIVQDGDTTAIGSHSSMQSEVRRESLPVFGTPSYTTATRESGNTVMFVTARVVE